MGVALAEEVDAIADRVREAPRELRVTREQLRRDFEQSIADLGRTLGMSARSLQRVLKQHGTSFRREVAAARFARAQELLLSGDQKVASVARMVGVSERGLSLMFRKQTGLSPAEWRKAQEG